MLKSYLHVAVESGDRITHTHTHTSNDLFTICRVTMEMNGYLGDSVCFLYHFDHSHHVTRCYATVRNDVQIQALGLPQLMERERERERERFSTLLQKLHTIFE